MQTIELKASKNYSITIDKNFSDLKSAIETIGKGRKIGLISDKEVFKIYKDEILPLLSNNEVKIYLIKSGEKSKNAKNYIKIINQLAKDGFNRSDLIIALGGGVVGDLAGFVSSTYMRGIKLISVPTSLLAMIDSSVGGKNAIDLRYGKNLCGTFYQPDRVCVNTKALETLPEIELMNGLGELVKYALLDESISFEQLKKENIVNLIDKCIKIKKRIVEQDEYDTNLRALLNLGHTIGHALEVLSRYKLKHGACVVKGLSVIAKISKLYYNFDQVTFDKINQIINSFGHDTKVIYNEDEIFEKIKLDKKSSNESVNVVLIKDIGKCEVVSLSLQKLKELLNATLGEKF